MKTLIPLITFWLFYCSAANAQTYWVHKTQLLEYLYNHKGAIDYVHCNAPISNIQKSILPIRIGKNFKVFEKLVKTNKSLYLLIKGTGIVFKATGINDTAIAFTKVDSTFFMGYNNDAFIFSYRDTLFSFGGRGFWKYNGQLLYFTEGEEWNMLPINEEIPFIDQEKIFYNQKKGNIFLSIQQTANEAVKTNPNYNPPYIADRFSLNERKHTVLGELKNNAISIVDKKDKEIIHWNAPTLGGCVIIKNGISYLLDFEHNLFFKEHSEKKVVNMMSIPANSDIMSIFQVKDTVYYSLFNSDRLYSFTISRSDFEKEGQPIYTPVTEFYSKIVLIAVPILAIAGFVPFWMNKRKKKQQISSSLTELDTAIAENEDNDNATFNAMERHLITSIIAEGTVSVDRINQILGINKKSIEIQKRARMDIINKINYKFKTIHSTEADLIERIRSEEDKRYFKYFIDEKNREIYG
ncbi:MAG: hypothetical protein KGO81_10800 [Bacteroidota bacterium]|nr:hypothetical protein [Bacteroidota bacterium]